MAQKEINNGDSYLSIRTAINENFTELYANAQQSFDEINQILNAIYKSFAVWTSGERYANNQVIYHDGAVYLCLVAHEASEWEPPNTATYRYKFLFNVSGGGE